MIDEIVRKIYEEDQKYVATIKKELIKHYIHQGIGDKA